MKLKDKKSLNNQKWTTKINIVIQKSVNDRIIRRILLFNTNRSAFVPCLKRFRFHHGPFENTCEIVSSRLNIHSGRPISARKTTFCHNLSQFVIRFNFLVYLTWLNFYLKLRFLTVKILDSKLCPRILNQDKVIGVSSQKRTGRFRMTKGYTKFIAIDSFFTSTNYSNYFLRVPH